MSCRAPRPMSRRPSRRSGPSATTSGAAAPKPSASTPPGSTASTWPPPGCRAEALDAALAGLDPAVRAALEEAVRRTRRVHSAQLPGRDDDPGHRGPHRHRALRPGRAGRGVRPRRPGGLSLLGRDEHRPGPGRGRRLDRGCIPAAGKPRRAAAPVRARRVRAARRARGARGRRGAGAGDVRLRHGGLRAGRRHHRAGQRLRGRGQAGAARRGGHRRRGRPHRGGDHRRRHRGSPPRRRRPGRAGRARRARGLPAHHHRRRPRRRGRRRAGQAGPGGQAPRAGRKGPERPVRVRARRRRRRGARGERRVGAGAPGDPGQGRGQAGGAGHQRGRGVRRPVLAGLARGLPGRLEPRAADRRDRAAHQRAFRVPLPAPGERGGVRPRARWPPPRR